MKLTVFNVNATVTYEDYDNPEWTGTFGLPTLTIAAQTAGDAIADYIKLARSMNVVFISFKLTFHPTAVEMGTTEV